MVAMPEADGVRLDRWLWAARFFKTRRLAVDAIKGGKVSVDGARAKPARTVRAGQRVSVTKGAVTFDVDVLGLSEQRGPATEAEKLYAETDASIAERERQRAQRRAVAAAIPQPDHRPDRRDRRRLAAFKRGSG
ncbi:RNA-binding S4 domain-containing protein [Sediminicurvatus halobius]|uniref:Heat shock protein 15 n=1 Tax=Sediminicurvatus halobius TaxID=2182432 RepID=A0A2U2N462_9GAMM|nr:RNA-binding S4 domain-containing protein [Spiribacter halobius]PWG63863.1 RNA-binding protein [Spiribacter halobius]UEX76266.1 RNA-binding S4 domain-containing protein [Spiribacter halobius]